MQTIKKILNISGKEGENMTNTNTNTIKLGLTDRHADGMPTLDGFVFPSVISDVTDVAAMDKMAADAILPLLNISPAYRAGLAFADYTDVTFLTADKAIDLYVTGLTALTVSVIKLAANNGISLTLWHFDRASGDYFPQVVFP